MRTAVPVPVKSTERATGGQCLFSLEIKLIVVVVVVVVVGFAVF